MSAPLLEAEHLVRRFAGSRRGWLGRRGPPTLAVDDVSLRVARGRCFGVVGESGSGKTTLARMLAGLLAPSAGTVRLDGEPLRTDSRAALRRVRRRLQYVHQNPHSALNPRLRVGRILEGPLAALLGLPAAERAPRVAEALARVGLEPDAAHRHPHAFSGGQAQRIAIARALIAGPDVLVLDEPTAGLDVRVQARVLALLARLRRELGTTCVLVSHDLAVVEGVCDEVAVMQAGRVVEQGAVDAVFGSPRHPYTRRLLAAVPVPGERRLTRAGG